MNSNTDLGKRVRRLLLKRGVNMTQLCERLDVSRATIYNLLTGTWSDGDYPNKVSAKSPAMKRLMAWIRNGAEKRRLT